MRRMFNMIMEPRGKVLRQLIHALGRYSSSVQMVLQEDNGLGEVGDALLARLEPYLLEQRRQSHWLGTSLVNSHATVYLFAAADSVFGELLAVSDGLYDWQQPYLPEDLALLREDGSEILCSICHEHDAYLLISDEERRTLDFFSPYLMENHGAPHEDSEPRGEMNPLQMPTLQRLLEWHAPRVLIETVDNAGWSLEVDLHGTCAADRTVPYISTERSAADWVSWQASGNQFQALGGPGNLAEMIDSFSDFAESAWQIRETCGPVFHREEVALRRLCDWYLGRCDGDRDVCRTIRIATQEQCEWLVTIDLSGTEWEGLSQSPRSVPVSMYEWYESEIADGLFVGRGGIKRLETVLELFFEAIDESERSRH